MPKWSVQELKSLAWEVADQFGLDHELFLRQIGRESNWNWRALGAKGEVGLAQLMPETARWLGVKDPWDPVQNLEGAASYMAMLIKRYGRYDLALAAYNAGPGSVDQRLDQIFTWPTVKQYVNDIMNTLGMPSGPPQVAQPPAPAPAPKPEETQQAAQPKQEPAPKSSTRPWEPEERDKLFPPELGTDQARIISREEYNRLLGPQPIRGDK